MNKQDPTVMSIASSITRNPQYDPMNDGKIWFTRSKSKQNQLRYSLSPKHNRASSPQAKEFN